MGLKDQQKLVEKLVTQAAAGDQQALSRLYNDNVRQLHRFIFFKVGNREDAEDLVQEVFIAAFGQLANFRGDTSFRNWCYEIAKRKIAQLWKQRYQMPVMDIEAMLGLETAITMETEQELTEKLIGDQMHADMAKKVLSQLKANHRQVLEYRFLKNYSIKETAIAMGLSESNTKVLQHRALKAAAQANYN